jgi:hypothetical protein
MGRIGWRCACDLIGVPQARGYSLPSRVESCRSVHRRLGCSAIVEQAPRDVDQPGERGRTNARAAAGLNQL